MNPLPVQRASQIPTDAQPLTRWLVQDLWSDQAVGILGGEPKCCKSFLALDLAVSVASGAPCLRQFPVPNPGPVLLFPAEDSLAVVRQRLAGICAAANVRFDPLPLDVITVPCLRLDQTSDRQRLALTVAALRPRLLILDPLIRLHTVDENDASQIAPMLSFLRQLQRQHQLAVLLVHHARKDAHHARPGQALRGSSELHGWGDSNLYLRRRGDQLTLSTEHRAAPSQDHIPLRLSPPGPALSLESASPPPPPAPTPSDPQQRVRQALAQLDRPVSLTELRQHCAMRTATLCASLAQLSHQGLVTRAPRGYKLQLPRPSDPVSPLLPIDPPGNGNGKPLQPPLPLSFSGG